MPDDTIPSFDNWQVGIEQSSYVAAMTDWNEADQRLLQRLFDLSRGFDPNTAQRVSIDVSMQALTKYQELSARKEQARLSAIKIEAEAVKSRAEAEKAVAEAGTERGRLELEHERLRIEDDRLQIEKANVIVKALGVLAEKGISEDKLIAVVQELGAKLLTGGTSPLALEDKKKSG